MKSACASKRSKEPIRTGEPGCGRRPSLLSEKGFALNQLATIFEIDRDFVSLWLDWWAAYNLSEALNEAGVSGEQVDYLIICTLSPNYQVPGIAPLVQRKIESCRQILAVD